MAGNKAGHVGSPTKKKTAEDDKKETDETGRKNTHVDTQRSLSTKLSKLSASTEVQRCLAAVQLPCRKCKDGMIELFLGATTFCLQTSPDTHPSTPPTPPPQDSQLSGAIMSDDVNYASDYFYTKKQGQIGSLAGLRLHTGWQVDGVI